MASAPRNDLNPTTETLRSVLSELDIAVDVSLGALVIDEGRVLVRAEVEAADDTGVTVKFDIFLAHEPDQILTHASTKLSDESAGDPALALREICRDWAHGCLDPVRRALNYDAKSDGYFYPFASLERQVLFSFYCGPCLAQGEDSSQWSRRFPQSLFDWLIAQAPLEYPDQRFNVLRFGMSADAEGRFRGLSLLNGSAWPEADNVMSNLKWPGPAPQQLLNYVVLQRIKVPPPDSGPADSHGNLEWI